VVLGPEVAARIACTTMGMAQAVVIALLLIWGAPIHALAVTVLLLAQVAAMRRLFRDPKKHAPWYNGTGVVFYVSGMMISAFALRNLGGVL
jgi:chlorophyll synthase